MKCIDTKKLMNDYMDGELEQDVQQELQAHLNQCSSCQQLALQQQQYKAAMASFQTPKLDSGRAANLMRKAMIEAEQQQHVKRRTSSFTQGFAAASVMALALTFGLNQWHSNSPTSAPSLTAQTNHSGVAFDSQELTLVIHAPVNMDGAQLILNLPADVSIQGQEHLAQVKWTVDLKEGENEIVLPVQFEPFAEFADQLMLSASLIHQNQQKDFEVDLTQENSQNETHGSTLPKEPALHPVV